MIRKDEFKTGFTSFAVGQALRTSLIAFAVAMTMVPSEASAAKKKAPAPKEVQLEAEASEAAEAAGDESLPVRLVVDPSVAKADEAMGEGAVDPMAVAALGATPQVAGGVASDSVVKPDTNKLSEAEIPVLATVKDTKRAAGGDYGRLIITLGVLTVLLGGASFAVRRWAGKKTNKKENTRIQVLTQHHLGPKKSVAILQVAGESILVGITDHNISMLKTLSLIDDEVPASVPRNFDRALDDYEETDSYERERESDEFAVRGLSDIRDVVSTRLKSMRNL